MSEKESVIRFELEWGCGCEIEMELDNDREVTRFVRRGPTPCIVDHRHYSVSALPQPEDHPNLVKREAWVFVKDYLKPKAGTPPHRRKFGSWVPRPDWSFQGKASP